MTILNTENKNNEQAQITHVQIIKSKPSTTSNVKLMKAYKFKKKNKKHGTTTTRLKNKGQNQSAPSRTSEENKNKKGRIKIKEQDQTSPPPPPAHHHHHRRAPPHHSQITHPRTHHPPPFYPARSKYVSKLLTGSRIKEPVGKHEQHWRTQTRRKNKPPEHEPSI